MYKYICTYIHICTTDVSVSIDLSVSRKMYAHLQCWYGLGKQLKPVATCEHLQNGDYILQSSVTPMAQCLYKDVWHNVWQCWSYPYLRVLSPFEEWKKKCVTCSLDSVLLPDLTTRWRLLDIYSVSSHFTAISLFPWRVELIQSVPSNLLYSGIGYMP
jgi:hypothetical protein